MSGRSVQHEVADAADPGLAWAEIGTIDKIEAHAAWGQLLTCTVQPDGRQVQARQLRLGARASGGVQFPLEVGDEVLLVFPGGDPNQAVALGGLTSKAAAIPSSADDDHVDVVHPGGATVRRTEGASVSGVVISAEFLADLKAFIAAVNLFMDTSSTAIAAPVIAGAALAYRGGTPPPAPNIGAGGTLYDQLGTSVAAGPGLPYASPALKTE